MGKSSLVLFILAILAAFLAFGNYAPTAAPVAKILFFAFTGLFVLTLFRKRVKRPIS